MKKRDTIIFWIATGLFSLMLTAGVITYFVKYEMTRDMFLSLGMPEGVIYPLAVAKILGVLAIVLIKHPIIKTLAYAGFALDLIAAFLAHLNAGDGKAFGPIIPLVLLAVSYVFFRRMNKSK